MESGWAASCSPMRDRTRVWEAEVIGANGRTLSLRWRDYPRSPPSCANRTSSPSCLPASPTPARRARVDLYGSGAPTARARSRRSNHAPSFEVPMTAFLDTDRVRALNDILRRTLSGGTLVLNRRHRRTGPRAPAAHPRRDGHLRPFRSPTTTRTASTTSEQSRRPGAGVLEDRLLRPQRALCLAGPADSSVTCRALTVMLAGEY